MNDDDGLDDNILQLLSSTSRPSSTSRRKGRKKVSFSNEITLSTKNEQQLHNDNCNNRNQFDAVQSSGNDKISPSSYSSQPLNGQGLETKDDRDDQIELRSFSRSQRSIGNKGPGLGSAKGMRHIDDLFDIVRE